MRNMPLLLALLMSAGCARDEVSYPSLARRATERVDFAEPAVAPPAPVTADPALDARLAAWTVRLDTVVAGFDGDAARAGKAIAANGARMVGGEAWLAAQGALAALDDWRAQAGGLTTELDDAARERAATIGTPYPPLDALRARADTENAREAAAIAALGTKLPTP